MSQPTIEIEASGTLERALQFIVSNRLQGLDTIERNEIKQLFVEVRYARCLQQFNNERQIRLPLPSMDQEVLR